MAQKMTATALENVQAWFRRATDDHQLSGSQNVAAVIGASSLAYILRQFYLNYRAWLALGPSGLPPTPLGWMTNWVIRGLWSSDTKSLSVYDEPWNDKYAKNLSAKEAELLRTQYLPPKGLPQRQGPRPAIAKFVVPHREREPARNMMMKQMQTNLIGYIHREYKDKTILGPSQLERGSPALFLLEGVPVHPVARVQKREICHSHLSADCPDRSSHCMLSYEDAKEVIRKGWAERHPLAGSPILGPSYVLVYSPRDEKELDVLDTILRASTKFMISLA